MRKSLISVLVFAFLATSLGPVPKADAAELLSLPVPGTMVSLSPAYAPVMIKGLTVHKDNPFLFDFIVDPGDSDSLPLVGRAREGGLKQEANKLIKYFLASLTIPEKNLWVNLSPYEKDRMIPEELSKTEMGRDLLAQDYLLKQITASLIYPEKELGKSFWDKVYTKAQQMYGTTEIPVNTFNKVWIMADKAEVFEHNQTAFVTGSHLKVMLEEDYLALEKSQRQTGDMLRKPEGIATCPQAGCQANEGLTMKATQRNAPNALASQIVRELILPELEKEVNTGKNFANLRQIFNSLILASWYKKNLKQALLNQVYSDKSKVKGLEFFPSPGLRPYRAVGPEGGRGEGRGDIEQIYHRYLQAYKKGVFNYIKEDINQSKNTTVPRKYFSGGWRGHVPLHVEKDFAMGAKALENSLSDKALVSMAVALNINHALPAAPDQAMAGRRSRRGQLRNLVEQQGVEALEATLLDSVSIKEDLIRLGWRWVTFTNDGILTMAYDGQTATSGTFRLKRPGQFKENSMSFTFRGNKVGVKDPKDILRLIHNDRSRLTMGSRSVTVSSDSAMVSKASTAKKFAQQENEASHLAELLLAKISPFSARNIPALQKEFPDLEVREGEEVKSIAEFFFEKIEMLKRYYPGMKIVDATRLDGLLNLTMTVEDDITRQVLLDRLSMLLRHGILSPQALRYVLDKEIIARYIYDKKAILLVTALRDYHIIDGNDELITGLSKDPFRSMADSMMFHEFEDGRTLKQIIQALSGGQSLSEAQFEILKTLTLNDDVQRNVFGITKKNVANELHERIAIFNKTVGSFRRLMGKLNIDDIGEDQFWSFYVPTALWLYRQKMAKRPNESYNVGFYGNLAVGKTTRAMIIAETLNEMFRGRGEIVVMWSLSDLYKSKAERQKLPMPKDYHGQIFRGPPGTHNIKEGIRVFEELRHSTAESTLIPQFDKALDDQVKPREVSGKVAIVIFEGWFVGANTDVDPERIKDDYKRYVAEQLKEYGPLFAQLDALIARRTNDIDTISGMYKQQLMLKQRAYQDQGRSWQGLQDEDSDAFIKLLYRDSWEKNITSPEPRFKDISILVIADENRRILHVRRGGRYHPKITPVKIFDRAMNVKGGIDLNAEKMQLNIRNDGNSIEMNIDATMLERIKRDGITSLTPVILRITPVANIWTFIDLPAPSLK